MDSDGKKRLLLVEDDAVIAMAEAAELRGFGYAVDLAPTGEKAVEAAGRDAGIDLVLMDIDLGRGIDGTEAARRILAARELPIVFLTSHAERECIDRVRAITRYGYVPKGSGAPVVQISIEMAFELFEANRHAAEELGRARASRDLAQGYLDVAAELILTVDAGGRIGAINDSGCALLRRPRAAILGHDLVGEFVDPPARPAARRALGARAGEGAGIAENFPCDVIAGDGRRVTVLWRAVPCGDRGGVVLCSGRDVTDLKRARDDLVDAHERCRAIVARLTDYVYAVRCADGRALGLTHDTTCEGVTGYSVAELAADPGLFIDMVHPEDRAMVAAHMADIAGGGDPRAIEYRIVRKNGGVRWVRNTPVPRIGGRGEVEIRDSAVQDITALKAAECRVRALLAEKALLKLELEHTLGSSEARG